eukprot:CAMPEP_0115860478 /NCGR_PEP_ID=MMETSP0287-20121206/17150_1 /TAXON_ID=412157 /ORGANISM="Chrysochromulina rotalis, Strain UIO044" /LENGTH=99 /DNA_ID=CAMNT_0003314807 /DNA_START=223 /DNA_END=518 /DNA_ORIENTATION=-
MSSRGAGRRESPRRCCRAAQRRSGARLEMSSGEWMGGPLVRGGGHRGRRRGQRRHVWAGLPLGAVAAGGALRLLGSHRLWVARPRSSTRDRLLPLARSL